MRSEEDAAYFGLRGAVDGLHEARGRLECYNPARPPQTTMEKFIPISVIGGNTCDEETGRLAEAVGRELAKTWRYRSVWGVGWSDDSRV